LKLIHFLDDEKKEFELVNYDDFITEMTFSVLEVGMDDEDTVNEIGKQLYHITDKIVMQKHENNETA